ncbi:ArnT family glycosyltransferase [Edaphobacter sp. HDX4]|uniref:ArnT family glycosyltransferase n=1 Tax=Edaphobacter sp. HDX4 TaxID=2794064 RepID=UPI003FA539AF
MLAMCGLFLLAMLVQVVGFKSSCGPYDEFLSLYGADSVLHGRIPYRDFWTLYGPAQFYLLAGFFKIFGVSTLGGRVYDALIRAGIACVCYSLARLLTSRRWAFIAFAAVIFWLTGIYYPAYNFPVYPATLASLVSCLFFASYFRHGFDQRSLFLAGFFVSITTIFRHDSGFYIFVAELVMLLWTSRTRIPGESTRQWAWTAGRRVLIYLAGVVLIAGPVYLVIVVKAGFQNVFYDLFYVPAVIYPKVRRLPFFTPETLQALRHPLSWDGRVAIESLIVLLPIFTMAATALALLTSRRSRIFPHNWQRQTFALLVLLASLFFGKGLIRVGPVQLLQSIIVCLTVLAILFGHLRELSRPVGAALTLTVLFLAVCTAATFSHILTFARVNLRDALHPAAANSFYHRCHPPAELSRARCMLVEPDELSAALEIERRSSPDQLIFIGNGRHDRLFWGDVRLYFLSDRRSVTRWYDLHPGVQTTLAIQNDMIDDIRREDPPVIALNSSWDDTFEPNDSRISSGVTALDDYIRSHYTPQASYGRITILAPNR